MKVEVAVLGSLALRVRKVTVDVKKKKKKTNATNSIKALLAGKRTTSFR